MEQSVNLEQGIDDVAHTDMESNEQDHETEHQEEEELEDEDIDGEEPDPDADPELDPEDEEPEYPYAKHGGGRMPKYRDIDDKPEEDGTEDQQGIGGDMYDDFYKE